MVKITPQLRDRMALAARDKIGTPYRLGAEVKPGDLENARDLDCSETTERLYNDYPQIPLPDGAAAQREYCEKNGKQIPYPLSKDIQPGDLVFLWDKDMARIGHVMMAIGSMAPFGWPMLIEARGRPYSMVCITSLDDVMAHFGTRFAGIYRLFEVI
ncbi:MAG: NlpC/P60 family protein [Candidatus Edwardsbacteria bacterium]|nr:NlpC/P60 family protein [Candidatus Edwardsbacteria bacterium]